MKKIINTHFSITKLIFALLLFFMTMRAFSLEIAGYSIHFYYLLFILLFVFLLPALYLDFKKINFQFLFVLKKNFYWLFFFLFLLSGILSIFYFYGRQNHANLGHSLIYWIWITGTFLVVIPTIIYFKQKEVAFVNKVITILLMVQSLILFYDFIICNLQYEHLAIGKYIRDVGFSDSLFFYRPHFLEDEPAYLVSYTVFLIAYFKMNILGKQKIIFKISTLAIYVFSLIGIFLTTSRTGLLCIAIFCLHDFYAIVKKRKEITFYLQNIKWFKNIQALIVSIVVMICLMVFLKFSYVFDVYFFRQVLINDKSNSSIHRPNVERYFSIAERKDRWRQGWKVFQLCPLLGVGIGNSFFVYYNFIEPKEVTNGYNHPISLNYYTEILSEWGIIGFFFFLMGMIFLLRQKSKSNFLLCLSLFLIISLSAHTITRFNLWVSIALLVYIPPYRWTSTFSDPKFNKSALKKLWFRKNL